MPRRPTRTVPTLLLHGISGSSEGHWQRWLADQLSGAGREVRFPELPDPDEPELGSWLAALGESMTGLEPDGFDVLAHSLGAILWLHHASAVGDAPRPARVALVAPPAPAVLPEIAPSWPSPPLNVDAVRRAADGTVLVGSNNDDLCPGGIARVYGAPLKMAATVIADGGHINIASGFGPWPAALDWCGRDNLAFIA